MVNKRNSESSHRSWRIRSGMQILFFALVVIALVGAPPPIQAGPAANIAVTTTADEFGTGDACSLREAIQAANSDAAFGGCSAGSGFDIIDLPAGTYTLTRAGAGDDDNLIGDLDIISGTKLKGVGQANTVVDGSGLDRVLHIHGGTTRLHDLTIRGGQAPHGTAGADGAGPGDDGQDGEPGQHGGGIHNAGELYVINSAVSDNQAGDGGSGGDGLAGASGAAAGEQGQGGGDGGDGGDGGSGGGIYSAAGATLILENSVVRNNVAGSGGPAGDGAAGGNGGTGGAGGYAGRGGRGGAGGAGGGIMSDAGADLDVDGCTVAGNHSGAGGQGGQGDQGGEGSEGASGQDGGDGGRGGPGGDGGGIASTGPLSCDTIFVEDNRTGSGGGGGPGGVAGTRSKGGGGGEGSSGGSGAGIYYEHDASLWVGYSIIRGNQTGDGGRGTSGGPGGDGPPGVSGGPGGDGGYGGSGGWGGGIESRDALVMLSATVSGNGTGQGGVGGPGGDGGAGGPGASGEDGRRGGDGGRGGLGGSAGRAGGIMSGDTLTMLACRILHNSTDGGGRGGDGGSGGPGGRGGNSPAGDGGPGGQAGDGGSGGQGGYGGGIYKSGSGEATIASSTIDGNFVGPGAAGGNGGDGGSGGGGGSGTPAGAPGENAPGGDGGSGGSAGWAGGIRFGGNDPQWLIFSTVSANSGSDGGHGGDGGDGGSNEASSTGRGGPGGTGGQGTLGGGVYNNESLILENSTISGNSTSQGGNGGDSGSGQAGPAQGGDGGPAGQGGGLYAGGTDTLLRAISSTIAGNRAMGSGGNGGSGVPPGAPGDAGLGGGLYVFDKVAQMSHTILGDNQVSGAGPDCHGNLELHGYNLLEYSSDCTLTLAVGDNILSQDPVLAALGNNGGTTDSHLPLPASPALDGGDVTCDDRNGSPQTWDQRGRTRPVDGNGTGGVRCDIGSVEVQAYQALMISVVGEGLGHVDSSPPGIDCGDGGTDCQQPLDLDTVVTLSATAGIRSAFAGWSGACSGSEITCPITMSVSHWVTATFDLVPVKVYLPLVLRDH